VVEEHQIGFDEAATPAISSTLPAPIKRGRIGPRERCMTRPRPRAPALATSSRNSASDSSASRANERSAAADPGAAASSSPERPGWEEGQPRSSSYEEPGFPGHVTENSAMVRANLAFAQICPTRGSRGNGPTENCAAQPVFRTGRSSSAASAPRTKTAFGPKSSPGASGAALVPSCSWHCRS
jgi:hypothetical protein